MVGDPISVGNLDGGDPISAGNLHRGDPITAGNLHGGDPIPTESQMCDLISAGNLG